MPFEILSKNKNDKNSTMKRLDVENLKMKILQKRQSIALIYNFDIVVVESKERREERMIE